MAVISGYREQYMFAQGVVDLSTVSASASRYLGGKAGLQTSAALCEPIDLKADKQMKYQKARLDIKCYEALAGSSGAGTLYLYTCDSASSDTTGYTPDTDHAVELFEIPISTANTPAKSTLPWMEITMPSNCKRFVFFKFTASANAFSAGKLLIHFNPNF